MVICCCDGTFDGILTAVFEAWTIDVNTTEISVGGNDNFVLFAEYREVETNNEKAARVAKAVVTKISEYAYQMIFQAGVTNDPERGNAILQFIRRGFEIGGGVTEDLKHPAVIKVFQLSRFTNRELMHYRGFLRFRQQGEYLLGRFEPKSDIITMMADFFSDRLNQDNFIIVDMKRNKAAIHRAGEYYFITEVDAEIVRTLSYTKEEDDIQELWEAFERTIAIEARRNLSLQKQNMPLRYRKYMWEEPETNSISDKP